MKRIVLTRPRTLEIDEAPDPDPGPGEALVRMQKVGVCGSDIHLFRDFRIGDTVIDRPFVIGHECMGTITAVGPGVDEGLVGRRVAIEPAISCGECEACRAGLTNACPSVQFLGTPPVQGAFKEFLAHPVELLEPLPECVGDEAAVVLEPMAIALHAVNLVKVRPGQRVAILGTGVVGTCVLALLGLYRGLHVVCADLMEDRLERARRMGAASVNATGMDDEEAAEATAEAIGGLGAHVVFECAGAAQTCRNMCEVAAPGGHVAVVGITDDDRLEMRHSAARRKGLTLRLVRRSLGTLRPCVELAARGAIRPEELVTHTFAAGEVERAFDVVDRHAEGVLKALIDMRQW